MNTWEAQEEEEEKLQVLSNYQAHLNYFNSICHYVPGGNGQLLPHRLLFLYFALTGCDLLGAAWITSDEDPSNNKAKFFEEIRSCYNSTLGGFHPESVVSGYPTTATLTMTHCALCAINLCNMLPRAFLGWLTKEKVLRFVLSCQVNSDSSFIFGKEFCGAFCAAPGIMEVDLRFTYSALISMALLYSPLPLSAVPDIQASLQRAVAFIWRCWNPHDGAFGAVPGAESHGGMTFCAVASLALAGTLSSITRSRHHSLLRFCVARVSGGPADNECIGVSGANKPLVGYQGRPQKDCDTCYSHWIGSTLCILSARGEGDDIFVDPVPVIRFATACVDPRCGGICKCFDIGADIIHSCLGLSGLLLHLSYSCSSTLQKPHAVYGCSWETVHKTGLPKLL